MILKKAEVTIRLIQEYTELDTLGKNSLSWREYPITVNTNLTDSVFVLVGSRKPLAEGALPSGFWEGYRQKHGRSVLEGKFLYPEERLNVCCKFEPHKLECCRFRAFEDIKVDKYSQNGFTRTYQVEVTYKNQTRNISPDLELPDTGNSHPKMMESGEKHSAYQVPSLLWVGDLNHDEVPDFIYYFGSMRDSCGVDYIYYLFLSDKDHPDRPAKKVAFERLYSCSVE